VTTDISERGLERLICTALAGMPCDPGTISSNVSQERPSAYGVDWTGGIPEHYDRKYGVDLAQLWAFLHAPQPEIVPALGLDEDGPVRRKFLARLQGEITKRGTIDVLRHGIHHGQHRIDLFYGTHSPGNRKAIERNEASRFSVTRQLRYSRDETQRALDLALFVNGLPVARSLSRRGGPRSTRRSRLHEYQSTRRFAARTTFSHRARSALICSVNSAGVFPTGSIPSAA
jgi:type I restriction enzyme R subunit